MKKTNSPLEQQIWQWLDEVVIGLNLCPFAKKPRANQQIRVCISEVTTDNEFVDVIIKELSRLDNHNAKELETTLVAVDSLFQHFDDFLEAINLVETIIDQFGYRGTYQVAHFHPQYQFDGTTPDDRENLTNKAPCAIFHLIREESMERVLKQYPNPESIFENNIQAVSTLSQQQLENLYPFLFSPK